MTTDSGGSGGATSDGGAGRGIGGVLDTLARGGNLSEGESRAVFEAIFRGELDEPKIAKLLTNFASRPVTCDELVGAARAMRAHATKVPYSPPPGAVVIDTCGTGGAPKTFNISTASAIVTAAAAKGKVRVAKHGNRSRTGRGSAEVLAVLGVNVDASPEVQARCLDRAGVCFCFAIHHHPAAKFAAGARKSLGIPTIFSMLGPLTNPAGATRQVIGIYDRGLVRLMAEALAALGAERALVVHGDDGMDEITTTARTHAAQVQNGVVSITQMDAAEAGAARCDLDALRAGTLEEAAAIVRRVIEGERGPRRDVVAVNAAAALMVGAVAGSLREGFELACAAIDSGEAARILQSLADVSHGR